MFSIKRCFIYIVICFKVHEVTVAKTKRGEQILFKASPNCQVFVFNGDQLVSTRSGRLVSYLKCRIEDLVICERLNEEKVSYDSWIFAKAGTNIYIEPRKAEPNLLLSSDRTHAQLVQSYAQNTTGSYKSKVETVRLAYRVCELKRIENE